LQDDLKLDLKDFTCRLET